MTEQGSNYPRQRKISECGACGMRKMCLSDDGGISWDCNDCITRYGVNRGKYYEDTEKVVAGEATFTDTNIQKEEKKIEETQNERPKPKTRKEKA